MKLVVFIFLTFFIFEVPTITIDKDKERWKPYYTDINPNQIVDKWLLPFNVTDRQNVASVKIISIFGDHRDSYYKGHIHTAIDINPAMAKTKLIDVYAMANGVVCSIHLAKTRKRWW